MSDPASVADELISMINSRGPSANFAADLTNDHGDQYSVQITATRVVEVADPELPLKQKKPKPTPEAKDGNESAA